MIVDAQMGRIMLPEKYEYVLAVLLGFWVQQSIIFVIPVVRQRISTGIKAPTLYPTDSEIKDLKLSPEQVGNYMRAQRVHQNNVEFLVTYVPMLLAAGFQNPVHAAIAGAVVWAGRMVTALGYWQSASARSYGGWFHIPELYTVYLVGKLVYETLKSN